jgi:hypothetical protein
MVVKLFCLFIVLVHNSDCEDKFKEKALTENISITENQFWSKYVILLNYD